MLEILLVVVIWIIAIIGICIMKKLQPDDRIYPAWAVAVCVLLTLFVGWYESWWSFFL
jgi:hypothetical protein